MEEIQYLSKQIDFNNLTYKANTAPNTFLGFKGPLVLWMICYNFMNIASCVVCCVLCLCVLVCVLSHNCSFTDLRYFCSGQKKPFWTQNRFSRISVELSVTQLNIVTCVKSSLKCVGLVYLFV